MSFKHIVGQKQPIDILKKNLEKGIFPHSYLFYGSESIGKKKTAITLAKSLNCLQARPVDSCGQCISCQKIDHGNHPDFFLIEPVKNSSTAKEEYIRINQIRDLQKKLNFLPYEGTTKVAIIDSAEKMNLQAANAFLKTLEEPPISTVLILIVTNLYQLLPTIVSRCQRIMFNPLPSEEVKKILSKKMEIDTAELDFRVSYCRGQINRALKEDLFLNSQNRKELLNLIDTTSFDQVDIIFQWSKKWSKSSDSLPVLLDELMNLLRDLAFLKSCCPNEHIFNKDMIISLKAVAVKKKLSALLEMFESVLHAKYDLQNNLNIQLTLETMLLKFCKTI